MEGSVVAGRNERAVGRARALKVRAVEAMVDVVTVACELQRVMMDYTRERRLRLN